MALSPPMARPIDAVIKLGGDVLEGEALADAAAEIARARAGRRLLVVHGGGPQVTALAKRLGVEANIVGGRRITDDPMLAIVKRVISGLNVDLVAALRADGVPAFGVSGASGVIRAHRRPPRVVTGAGDAPIDFGLVGDIDGFDLDLLDALDARDALPVIACLGADASGVVLNINADVVASQLAGAAHATALVACTAVGGVRRDKDDPATRLARLTVAEAKAAIADGTVQGGMIPKLEEAFAPLAAGVAAVHIVAPSEIATSLLEPGSVGTLLVP
ncbi:MAG TPA: acetylglutamate kinase [Polyangia bacterium]|nr:acetylglutamate kinase [Polyangia bacterium]